MRPTHFARPTARCSGPIFIAPTRASASREPCGRDRSALARMAPRRDTRADEAEQGAVTGSRRIRHAGWINVGFFYQHIFVGLLVTAAGRLQAAFATRSHHLLVTQDNPFLPAADGAVVFFLPLIERNEDGDVGIRS